MKVVVSRVDKKATNVMNVVKRDIEVEVLKPGHIDEDYPRLDRIQDHLHMSQSIEAIKDHQLKELNDKEVVANRNKTLMKVTQQQPHQKWSKNDD